MRLLYHSPLDVPALDAAGRGALGKFDQKKDECRTGYRHAHMVQEGMMQANPDV